MSFRIQLQSRDGQVYERSSAKSSKKALDLFKEIISREDLEGAKLQATLLYNNRALATHRFELHKGDQDFWRGRVDEIEVPTAGRPVELSGGKRVNVYLDADTLELAAALGAGNVSEGIRRAIQMASRKTSRTW